MEKDNLDTSKSKVRTTNVMQIPEVFRRYSELMKHDSGEADISVTSLIDSPQIRQLAIENYDKIVPDLADEILALHGTAIHQVLELGYGDGDIVEMRLSAEYAGKIVSGQIDLLTPTGGTHEDGKPIYDLEDVKSIGGMKLAYNGGKDPGWEKQVNMYNLLCEDNGYHIRSLYINGVVKDWSAANVRNNSKFPAEPFVRVPIYKWDHDEATEYAEGRVRAHFEQEDVQCTDVERWATKPKYAVYGVTKGGSPAKRATRVFDTRTEADRMLIMDLGGQGRIEVRSGRDIRCESWCNVSEWCEQNKEAISR